MLDFHDLYTTYADEVYRFSLWMAGDRYEAEDITSETFVRAWARKGTIRTETLKAYLFTIARNIYLGRLRKAARQVDLGDHHPDPVPGPEKVVQSQLDLLGIKRILQTIPEIDRAAFVMRVQHDLPYAEIARVLGTSLAAAKVKVHRVRKKLIVTTLAVEEVS